MRKKIVAGNWKMNKNLLGAIDLAKNIVSKCEPVNTEVILAPSYPFLYAVGEKLVNSPIKLAAQDCYINDYGAYTGEVSAPMLASLCCSYVIIGHSERRANFNEGNNLLLKKVRCALENNMKVIFCCGENLNQRESGAFFNTIKEQLTTTVFTLPENDFRNIVIAYEPIWAIGTGKTATPNQAQEMHKFIRDLIREYYTEELASKTSLLYGGSCKPSNCEELFSQPDIDGGLIGGASLDADDFTMIIHAMEKISSQLSMAK